MPQLARHIHATKHHRLENAKPETHSCESTVLRCYQTRQGTPHPTCKPHCSAVLGQRGQPACRCLCPGNLSPSVSCSPSCISSIAQVEGLHTALQISRFLLTSLCSMLQRFLSCGAHLILVQLAHQWAGDEVVTMHGHHQRPAVRRVHQCSHCLEKSCCDPGHLCVPLADASQFLPQGLLQRQGKRAQVRILPSWVWI